MKYFIYLFLLFGRFLGVVPTFSTKNKQYVENDDIEDAIEFALTNIDRIETFETNILEASRIRPLTPSYGYFMNLEPDWTAIRRGRQAQTALGVYAQLAYSFCLNRGIDEVACDNLMGKFYFSRSSLSPICSHIDVICTPEEYLNKYRSVDGSCNRIKRRALGESYTAYSRLLHSVYSNFDGSPKRSATRAELPCARTISNAIVKHEKNPLGDLTVAFSQWGQFLEYDLSRFAAPVMYHHNESFTCCEDSGFALAPRYTHPKCMPIFISSDDDYYGPMYVECMSYTRSLPAVKSECKFGSLEQQNQATHYLDGSQIYGNNINKSFELRDGKKGKLKTSLINNEEYLPLSRNPQQYCMVKSEEDICFTSGDNRVNFLPQVAVMHTLWVREHNRVAEELSKLNEEWDDDTIYQEARRIVIAEIQHITYEEWSKYLLDKKRLMRLFKQNKFDKKIDPRTSNEFASAAIRSLYSTIPNYIGDENKCETNRLANYFNKPGIIVDEFDLFVRFLATQGSNKIGTNFAEDLRNRLFSDGQNGYDILSLDIQRGRDHGLPGYNYYRQLCGFPKVSEMQGFGDFISKMDIQALSKVYKHVDDVDLIVGGLLEQPQGHSRIGPTFSCIIEDQLRRTKAGDRYFYTNSKQPQPFSDLQLSEIRKVTLAGIFCDNSGIEKMPPKVFEKLSKRNVPVKCEEDIIPRLNLKPWQNVREKYYF